MARVQKNSEEARSSGPRIGLPILQATTRSIYGSIGGHPTLGPWIRPTVRPAMANRRDDFKMDFENVCLRHYWDGHASTQGLFRWQDYNWGEIMHRACQGHNDVTYEQYIEWCVAGGGDEWFYKENLYGMCQEDFPGELRLEVPGQEARLEL